jgi:integrase
MKLTAQAVQRLRHEGPLHFRDIKDDTTRGLYLRILQSGERRWIVRYRIAGRIRVATIGNAAVMPLAAARAQALAWVALVKDGRDPATEAQRKRHEEKRLPTVAAFAEEYLERHAKPNKKSWRTDERLLHHDVLPAIGHLRIDHVKRRDVALLLDVIRDRGANVLANRTLALARQLFGFAIERGVLEHSPLVGLRASRETPRARTLTDDEVRRLWAATGPVSASVEPSTRLALRLLLLTGARASEVCGAAWEEFDVDAAVWIIPAGRTKNAHEHHVPLSDAALEIVREAAALCTSSWLLPASSREGHVTPSGVLQAVRRILGADAVTHDLRRTVATGLQKLGVRLEVTESVLNHVGGSRAGVVGVYQRHNWQQEKVAALSVWARHVLALTDGNEATANVVQLVRTA